MKSAIALIALIGLAPGVHLDEEEVPTPMNLDDEQEVPTPLNLDAMVAAAEQCEDEECCLENLGEWIEFEGESGEFYCDGCLSWGGEWDLRMNGEYVCGTEYDQDVTNMYPQEILEVLECFGEWVDLDDADGGADEACDQVCAAFGGEWVAGEAELLKQCNRETEDWCFGEWTYDPLQNNEYCDDCIPWGGEWATEVEEDGTTTWWCDDCTPLGGEWLYSEQDDEYRCDYRIIERSTLDADGELVFNEVLDLNAVIDL